MRVKLTGKCNHCSKEIGDDWNYFCSPECNEDFFRKYKTCERRWCHQTLPKKDSAIFCSVSCEEKERKDAAYDRRHKNDGKISPNGYRIQPR